MSETPTVTAGAGQVIVREGDLVPKAYRIESGRVEVYRERGGRESRLAVLEAGQVFGELGLVFERPRTASVRALEATRLEAIDGPTFNRLLREDPESVVPILQALIERLRSMGMRYMVSGAAPDDEEGEGRPGGTQAASPGGAPTLLGASPAAKAALEAKGGSIRLEKLPFRVGRSTGGMFADVFSSNDLLIGDSPPFQVSRNHFSIHKHPDMDSYYVKDRGSALGTVVNGRKIGGKRLEGEAMLDASVNEIRPGSEDSPFRFELRFE